MTPAERQRVVDEAHRWLDTPFHHGARLRGVGVDCVNLLAGVFTAAGIVDAPEFEYYPSDWNLHRDEPRFLAGLMSYADRVTEAAALPGDIAMFRYGRHAAHGAIVVAWPVVIHAWLDQGKVVLSEADNGPLAGRLHSIWRVRRGG